MVEEVWFGGVSGWLCGRASVRPCVRTCVCLRVYGRRREEEVVEAGGSERRRVVIEGGVGCGGRADGGGGERAGRNTMRKWTC